MAPMTQPIATWKFIRSTGIKLGAKPTTVTKWRQQGVPHYRRLEILREAAMLGILVPDEEFQPRVKRRTVPS